MITRGTSANTIIAATLALVVLTLMVVGACSNSNDEVVDLLNDPKIGLSHLNEELHSVRGEDLLANPKIGLEHLNDELHTVRVLATDPKMGFEHLNAEVHTIKELLSELSQQLESLRQEVQ